MLQKALETNKLVASRCDKSARDVSKYGLRVQTAGDDMSVGRVRDEVVYGIASTASQRHEDMRTATELGEAGGEGGGRDQICENGPPVKQLGLVMVDRDRTRPSRRTRWKNAKLLLLQDLNREGRQKGQLRIMVGRPEGGRVVDFLNEIDTETRGGFARRGSSTPLSLVLMSCLTLTHVMLSFGETGGDDDPVVPPTRRALQPLQQWTVHAPVHTPLMISVSTLGENKRQTKTEQVGGRRQNSVCHSVH